MRRFIPAIILGIILLAIPTYSATLVDSIIGPNTQSAFGFAVAVDANTMVVGAPTTSAGQGAVNIYTWDATGWLHQQTILGSSLSSSGFGYSVDVEGNTIAVGAMSEVAGYVYLFDWDGTNWVQTDKLQPGGLIANAQFGFSLDLDGDTLAVGANNSNNGLDGHAFIYRRNAGVWSLDQTISQGGYFGFDVSLDGNWLAVGFPPYGLASSGKVQLYQFDGTQFIFKQTILPSVSSKFPTFGRTIDLNGSTLLIGGGTSAYTNPPVELYQYDGTNWVLELSLPNPTTATDEHGYNVLLDNTGNYFFFSRRGANEVLVYSNLLGSWALADTIIGEAAGDGFGHLALSGANLIIGAPYANNFGTVYTYNGYQVVIPPTATPTNTPVPPPPPTEEPPSCSTSVEELQNLINSIPDDGIRNSVTQHASRENWRNVISEVYALSNVQIAPTLAAQIIEIAACLLGSIDVDVYFDSDFALLSLPDNRISNLAYIGETITFEIDIQNPTDHSLRDVEVIFWLDPAFDAVDAGNPPMGDVTVTGNKITLDNFELQSGNAFTWYVTLLLTPRANPLAGVELFASLESPDASIHYSPIINLVIPSQLPASGETPIIPPVLLLIFQLSIATLAGIYLLKLLVRRVRK